MNRAFFLSVALACLIVGHPLHADPIHPIAGGAFWHHDSGWEFPEKSGEFMRVGIPQDVAGSRDAVAYYARVIEGSRIVAAVDVYPADSAAAPGMVVESAGKLSSETALVVGTARPLSGTRRIFTLDGGTKNVLTALYLISAGEWRVRIRIEGANAQLLPMLDAFALGQRWDTLSAPTPR